MNTRVLTAIYRVMREHWLDGSKLFERKKFRSWMRKLNRRGGICLLDALPDDMLDSLVREEAEATLEIGFSKLFATVARILTTESTLRIAVRVAVPASLFPILTINPNYAYRSTPR